MNMNYNYQIEEAIKKRVSVRTYSEQEITEETKREIGDYINTLSNPFGVKVNFKLIESDAASGSEKLGTYGIIKGAKNYIGSTVGDEAFAFEALGFEFEKLILHLTAQGLGTCWLGGTFNRGAFEKAMELKEGVIFPIVSPFGFPAKKKSLADSMLRSVSKGDSRKSWSELFFNKDFSAPLSAEAAGDYYLPLEMVKLAPSASNKQPWRIIKDENTYHFCEYKTPGYSKAFSYDIQRIDMGIAACHFQLTALEKGLKGEFRKLPELSLKLPENVIYSFSWVS